MVGIPLPIEKALRIGLDMLDASEREVPHPK
jgi:hypothetical protein